MTARFGDFLRNARLASGLSQLALGLRADVSARHISYLEAGKARPSREMVSRLAECLGAAEYERDRWLLEAGFAPSPRQHRALDDAALAPYLAAVDRLLERHDPYPGWALDADWKVIRWNRAGARLLNEVGLGEVGPGEVGLGEVGLGEVGLGEVGLGEVGLGEDACLVAALAADPSLGGRLVNWREVSAHLAHRLAAEARRRDDRALAQIASELSAAARGSDERSESAAPGDAALATILEINGARLSLVSLLSVFNTADDRTLADLRMELFFPTDAATAAYFGTPRPRAGDESAIGRRS
ncbi:MAG: helix-turn-helix domain-containing protein [Pseudomonadota bacterium]